MDPEVNKSADVILQTVEAKIRALYAEYQQIKSENQQLRAEIENLQQQIVHQKNTLHHESENNILINIAKSISDNGYDKGELLESIDRILKQLDEYILKLND